MATRHWRGADRLRKLRKQIHSRPTQLKITTISYFLSAGEGVAVHGFRGACHIYQFIISRGNLDGTRSPESKRRQSPLAGGSPPESSTRPDWVLCPCKSIRVDSLSNWTPYPHFHQSQASPSLPPWHHNWERAMTTTSSGTDLGTLWNSWWGVVAPFPQLVYRTSSIKRCFFNRIWT